MILTQFYNHLKINNFFAKFLVGCEDGFGLFPLPSWNFLVEEGITLFATGREACCPSLPISKPGLSLQAAVPQDASRGGAAPCSQHRGCSGRWVSLSLSWLWPWLLCAMETTHMADSGFHLVYWREREFNWDFSEITKCQTSHSWLPSIPKFIPDSTLGPSGWECLHLRGAALPWVGLSACLHCSHFQSWLCTLPHYPQILMKKVASTQVWRIPAKLMTSAYCTFSTIFF